MNAEHHVQVVILERGDVGQFPSKVPTRVRVVRIFKIDSHLKLGSEFSIDINVYHNSFPEDAGGWINILDYNALQYAEVYLNGAEQNIQIAAFGAEIWPIDSPSNKPIMPCPVLEEIEAEEARWG